MEYNKKRHFDIFNDKIIKKFNITDVTLLNNNNLDKTNDSDDINALMYQVFEDLY
jgi:hypothetical protein